MSLPISFLELPAKLNMQGRQEESRDLRKNVGKEYRENGLRNKIELRLRVKSKARLNGSRL